MLINADMDLTQLDQLASTASMLKIDLTPAQEIAFRNWLLANFAGQDTDTLPHKTIATGVSIAQRTA